MPRVADRAPWCVLNDDAEPPRLLCERCGQDQPVALPLAVTAFVRALAAFHRAHKDCKEPSCESP